MDFAKNYARLNAAQKQAVDLIDGPLMVVAGPGTGKTQLLSMRVANILRKTDVSAGNILCLTFTESGAANMTARMAELFGPDAYRVAVHTFHSFGSEIINHHGQYFYNGANFSAADDITSREILEEILRELPHSSPLSSQMNGQFTYLGDVATAISALKKSGLTPDEAHQVLRQNAAFDTFATPILRKVFTDRISKSTIDLARRTFDDLKNYDETKLDFATEPPLSQLLSASLERAIVDAETSDKTAPLTMWKKSWLSKNDAGEIVLTDEKLCEKLIEVTDVYDKYLRKMTTESMYDFDDMILRVTHALEIFPELKYDLQEQFQYILVDEFQDTNDAQMRLLRALTDYDARPNVMVVGDDDQAIFRFQGADISNIQTFSQSYKDVKTVVLTENYRSAKPVLDVATHVISQADERLATLADINKTLTVNVKNTDAEVSQITADDAGGECNFVATEIAQNIADGAAPESIAVIARRHADLANLLPFLTAKNVAVDYEREMDVLASPPIEQLEIVARIVQYIAASMPVEADELLPRMLAFPAWQISPRKIWELSLDARKSHKSWLETMLTFDESTTGIAEWLIRMAAESQNEPLEVMIDHLFGRDDQIADDNTDDEPFSSQKSTFVSPLKSYFFATENLAKSPEIYLEFLSDISTLRRITRDYHPERKQLLADFIGLIDTYRDMGQTIRTTRKFQTGGRVQLLTAHKAKGLEFDTVYVINASSQNWGEKSRSRGSLIKFPRNMPFVLSGDSNDERIRLLFVALTRAKRRLVISMHAANDAGKEMLPLEYLLDAKLSAKTLQSATIAESTFNLETAWHAPITAIAGDMRELLAETLARYKLSATHLNNFIDVADGGPQKWLMQNLLRFPQAKSPAAAFGTAIHAALQRAHLHLSATGNLKPLEDVLGDFANVLGIESMTDRDYDFYHQKGIDVLSVFYDQRAETFAPEQIVERNFGSENIVVDGARLSGAVDLIQVDRETKTIRVTDYKTGKAAKSWHGRTDWEKIKLRKYRQQLMFYKLLIEQSREFTGYCVTSGVLEFVEPVGGEIVQLEMTYDDAEMTEFRKLIVAVWAKIQSLDLPQIDDFSQDFAGMCEFEISLIEKEVTS